MFRSLWLAVALVLAVAACTKVENPTAPSHTLTPPATSTPPTPGTDRIEYVIQGANLISVATIRFADPREGLTLTTSSLPYVATVTNTDPTAFLYVEASAFGATTISTLQVQIFVNGKIFREAATTGLNLFASASGTFQR
jgi:hypothetical protein